VAGDGGVRSGRWRGGGRRDRQQRMMGAGSLVSSGGRADRADTQSGSGVPPLGAKSSTYFSPCAWQPPPPKRGRGRGWSDPPPDPSLPGGGGRPCKEARMQAARDTPRVRIHQLRDRWLGMAGTGSAIDGCFDAHFLLPSFKVSEKKTLKNTPLLFKLFEKIFLYFFWDDPWKRLTSQNSTVPVCPRSFRLGWGRWTCRWLSNP